MLSLTDALALSRTHLANERTLLAYVRTALALSASGVGLIELFERPAMVVIGWILMPAGFVTLLTGVARFGQARARLDALERSAGVKE